MAVAKTPGAELVPFTSYAMAAMDTPTLLDVLRENVGHAINEFDLERVKVPTAGGTLWSIPTLEDEPEDTRTLDGIIVYHREPRAYWKEAYGSSGGVVPPDCSSTFGDIGIGEPGGDCDRCPMAAWGSKGDGARGQACKQMKLLFLLRPDGLLPIALFLPPTSIGAARSYLLRLTSRGKHYSSVVTRLTLEKTKNADSIEYSVVKFAKIGDLDSTEYQRVRAYSDALRGQLDTVTIAEEDVPESE